MSKWKLKTVYVEWVDSASTNEWLTKNEIVEPAKVVSIGFLKEKTKERIVVCASKADNDSVGDCIAIPRRAITKMRSSKEGVL